MTDALRDQLAELADTADAAAPPHTDLVAGALARARRHRRNRAATVGVATLAVAAISVTPLLLPVPWADSSAPASSVRPEPDASKRQLLEDLDKHTPPPAKRYLPTVIGNVPAASGLVFHGDTVDAVDAATGRRVPILRLSKEVAGALPVPNTGSLSPDGTKLAVPSSALTDGSDPEAYTGIWVFDLPSGKGKLYETAGQPTGALQWSPDGTRLWAWRWVGRAVYTLDVPGGTFTEIPGVVDMDAFWNGPDQIVATAGGWRLVDPATGQVVRRLPQLAAYGGAGPWAPGEFGGWSPDGSYLGVEQRTGIGVAFAVVDVDTGRILRQWGPFGDLLNTQNILGWSDPHTMVVMLRPEGDTTGVQLWELDVRTGTKKLRATYADADSAYVPANGTS